MDIIGDLDGNGAKDFIIGLPTLFAANSIDSKSHVGFVYMNTDNTVLDLKILNKEDFSVEFQGNSLLGFSVKTIGDINNDGTVDFAATAPLFNDNSMNSNIRGAFYLFHMGTNGEVNNIVLHKNREADVGSFQFGYGTSLAASDFNNDGLMNIFIGSPRAENTNEREGIVNIYQVNSSQKVEPLNHINKWKVPINGPLNFADDVHFGQAITILGDITGDGIEEILCTANKSDNPDDEEGNLMVFSLDAAGNVIDYARVYDSALEENILVPNDRLGQSVAIINDRNDDGFPEIVVAVNDVSNGNKGKIRIINTDFSYLLNTTTSIESLQSIKSQFSIYPNPSSNYINLELDNLYTYDYKIINALGKNIMNGSLNSNFTIDIESLANGSYWIVVRNNENKEFVKKFVKQ